MDRDTDRDWQEFGRTEPYWAVLTDEKFKQDKLTPESLDGFFQSGDAHVSWTFEQIRYHLDPDFDPERSLDFGCGVGRLTLPLAQRCRSATGVDISPAMLEKARAHAAQHGLTNISFIQGDDELSNVEGSFDFIQSYIVLQHIPSERGERLIRRLLELLRDGGFGALQLTYSKNFYWPDVMHRPPQGVRATFRAFCHELKRRLLQGRSPSRPATEPSPQHAPIMQMYDYNLNRIFHFLQQCGVRRMVVCYSNHGGPYGVLLLFRKEPGEPCWI